VGCSSEEKLQTLQDELAVIRTELDAAKEDLTEIKSQVNVDKLMKSFDTIAYLTPGSDGYSVVKSDLGTLVVSIANIAPYANGSKVTLQFGNLYSGTIDGLKAVVEWGPVDEKGFPLNDLVKTRDVVFKESFSGGAWTKSQIILEGVVPQNLGFVRIKEIGHTSISLRPR
jgi:hypothetical protein